MARTYRRDNRGRFASAGGGGRSRPATRQVQRGTNRLTRDNSGRITSVGGDGATARGGRLRTASGKQRGKVVATMKGGGGKIRKPISAGQAMKPVSTPGRSLGGATKAARFRAPSGTMKGPVTLAGLQKAGGNRWQKNGMDRVYFNNITEKAGMKINRYNTGNISSAAIKRRGISNAQAREITRAINESKVFYDRKTKKMMVTTPGSRPDIRRSQQVTAKNLVISAARKLKKESRMKPKMWRKGRRAK